jgi:hypothetical protein
VAVAVPARSAHAELATPRLLDPDGSTTTEQLRAKQPTPLTPAKLLREQPATAPRRSVLAWLRQALFLLLVVVGGSAVGLILGWVFGRF